MIAPDGHTVVQASQPMQSHGSPLMEAFYPSKVKMPAGQPSAHELHPVHASSSRETIYIPITPFPLRTRLRAARTYRVMRYRARKTRSACSSVNAMSCPLWAVETNAASNWLGAK